MELKLIPQAAGYSTNQYRLATGLGTRSLTSPEGKRDRVLQVKGIA
jgi:hypothetical protein